MVTHEHMATTVMPAIKKAMLRNPENVVYGGLLYACVTVLAAVVCLLRSLDDRLDASVYCLDFIQLLTPQLTSIQEEGRYHC